ncbi:HAMP domain-containing histidine kinase [bacterium]|nr:HAMP domain-containing histidine kinase [bacterium]
MVRWLTAGIDRAADPLRESLLYQRVRAAGRFVLAGLAVLAAGELIERPGENPAVTALQLLTALGVVVALAVLARTRRFESVVVIAVAAELWCGLGSAAIAIATGHTATSLIVLVSLAAGTAVFVPWGARPQVVVALWNSAMFALEVLVLYGALHDRSRELVALVVINLGTVFIARELQRQRHLTRVEQRRRLARERELEENAGVAAALAKVGEGLIAGLNRADLLQRLCGLAQDALGADSAQVWLLDPARAVYQPTCRSGDREEGWEEAVRLISVPADSVEVHRAAADRDGALWIPAAELAMPYRLLAAELRGLMWITLRRAAETAGVLLIAYRDAPEPGERALRIARGVAQLASMALENARLHDELRRANNLKSEFMATMSHELRTPLNVIIGYGSLLLEGAMGPLQDGQAATLQRMHDNAVQLLELINATLDVSRLESGRIPLDLAPVDLAAVLAEVEARTRDLRARAGVTCTFEVAADVGPLVTDAAKLRIILVNLVGNALKFTAAGRVSVRVGQDAGGVELVVSDTGIGIAKEVQEAVFEPFRQADASIGARFGGVGLGLFIVQRLVAALGGTIELESEVGRGSTFRIRLPGGARAFQAA